MLTTSHFVLSNNKQPAMVEVSIGRS